MIRYFTNNRVIEQGQEFLIQDDWVEVETPCLNGKSLPKHKLESQVQLKEDGTKYDVYNDDGTVDTEAQIKLDNNRSELALKEAKSAAKLSIIVTTSNGNTFDGDSESRNNMMSALHASEVLGQTSTVWKLADDTEKEVSIDEIKEALALSIQECGRIVMCNTIEEL